MCSMGYLNIRNRSQLIIIFFFFFSFCILLSLFCRTYSEGSDHNSSASSRTNLQIMHCQPIANCAKWKLLEDRRRAAEEVVGDHEDLELRLGRRELGGLGSSPPRCSSKCGKCTPCKAVHVPVRPGTPVTAEYYPEAWRCKCGNKIYMP